MKSRGFLAFGLSTYDFSNLFTTLTHNLIKEKLPEIIEKKHLTERAHFIWLVTIKNNLNDINCGHVRKFVMFSIIFLDIIFIRFGSNLYRQIVDIPMGTICAPLVADFFFCFVIR